MSHIRRQIAVDKLFVEVTEPECANDHAPCVVFVHGLGGNSSVHYPIQERIAQHHPTVTLDLAGLGRSREVRPISLERWVSGVLAVMDATGRERFVLVGHSLGTLIARHVAAKTQSIEGLVLFGPIAAPSSQEIQRLFAERARMAVTYGMRKVADDFGVQSLSAETVAHRPLAVAMVRELLLGQDPASYAACCKVLGHIAEAGEPAYAECRTLLVWGSEDAVSSEAQIDRCEKALGGTTVARAKLENIGHWPTIEATSHCLQLLRNFLRGFEQAKHVVDSDSSRSARA